MPKRIEEILKQLEQVPEDERSINYAEREFDDERAAKQYFAGLRERFVELENWNEHAGLSSYETFDQNGEPTPDQRIRAGLFIKIALTGSGKADWVRVEEIYEATDELIITVRPTFDPTADEARPDTTSHFFSRDATNNFCAVRDDRFVRIYVIGLNEKLNSDETSGIVETVRNAAVANVGSYLGVQSGEWTKFCNSFLSAE
jgi:hypothetical protein